MKKVSEYLQHAADCRSLASDMPIDQQRRQLLTMAQTWERLAEERERSARHLESRSLGSPESACAPFPDEGSAPTG